MSTLAAHHSPTYRIDLPVGGPTCVLSAFGHTIMVVAHNPVDALQIINAWTAANPDMPIGLTHMPSFLASVVVTDPIADVPTPHGFNPDHASA